MSWKNIASLIAVGAAATLSVEAVVWLIAR
jgi:hypothetical protein